MLVLTLCTPKSKGTPVPHTQVSVGIHFSEQEKPPPFFSVIFFPTPPALGITVDTFSLKQLSFPDNIADTN